MKIEASVNAKVLAASVSAVAAIGLAACGGGESDTADDRVQTSAPPATTGTIAPTEVTDLDPQDEMELAEGYPWRLANPQPWGPNNTMQVDSRATPPADGPVGVYAEPRQDLGPSIAQVRNGQEYEPDCYMGEAQGAQWIQNAGPGPEGPEGSYGWYRIILNDEGQRGFAPATHFGFTALDPQGQHDGTLPLCE